MSWNDHGESPSPCTRRMPREGFTLRPGAWSDGTPLTAADAVWTGETVLKYKDTSTGLMAGYIEGVEKFEALDEHTLRITWSEAKATALANLQPFYILPKHVFENSDVLKTPASLSKPVGAGPYMLTEWVRGSHLTFVKNPKYWGAGEPFLDRLIVKIMPDASARLLALHPKRIDLSLDRIERLLAALGHPERRLPPVIHVAGTNGKGSTVAFLRAKGLLDVGRRVLRQHEIDHVRHDDVVHRRAAGIEHERRGDQERQKGALLLPVEARRDEQPDLRGDQREAHDQRHESRQLHRDEEELEDIEDDDLVAILDRLLDQEREDRLGEVERDEEDQQKADQRIDQALAQLDQVIEQRHRLVVFRSVVRLSHWKVITERWSILAA